MFRESVLSNNYMLQQKQQSVWNGLFENKEVYSEVHSSKTVLRAVRILHCIFPKSEKDVFSLAHKFYCTLKQVGRIHLHAATYLLFCYQDLKQK